MQWVAAEQLLEHESEPEPDYGQAEPPHCVAASLSNFDLDDRDFSCTCAIHRPNLANRKTTDHTQAAGTTPGDLNAVLAALRPNLIKTARYQLLNRSLDGQLAEDVVQDALVRYFARLPEYRGPHELGGWLRKAVGWIVAERLRRRDLLEHCSVSLDEPATFAAG
jgi:hypothetical protein